MTVCVAYDIDTGSPEETLPNCLGRGYIETRSEITLSGVAGHLRLCSAVFSCSITSPVTVTLGRTLATREANGLNNDLVIVVEN